MRSPPPAAPAKKAIILIIDPDAEQSEVVKQVIEALEKAGFPKAESVEVVPQPEADAVSVLLQVQRDVPYQDLMQLVEHLKTLGVSQLAFQTTETAGNQVQIRAGANTPHDAVKRLLDGLKTFQEDGKSPLKFSVTLSQVAQEPVAGDSVPPASPPSVEAPVAPAKAAAPQPSSDIPTSLLPITPNLGEPSGDLLVVKPTPEELQRRQEEMAKLAGRWKVVEVHQQEQSDSPREYSHWSFSHLGTIC